MEFFEGFTKGSMIKRDWRNMQAFKGVGGIFIGFTFLKVGKEAFAKLF